MPHLFAVVSLSNATVTETIQQTTNSINITGLYDKAKSMNNAHTPAMVNNLIICHCVLFIKKSRCATTLKGEGYPVAYTGPPFTITSTF
jgi:hypothetical protein